MEEPPALIEEEYRSVRQQMVQDQLIKRGIHDQAVLKSMAKVPREEFVLPEWKNQAYQDSPLPIGFHQTISQPYIVASMIQEAKVPPNAKVLEIGTGSGYAAAILAQMSQQVVTIERIEGLTEKAKEAFQKLGYTNIESVVGDGSVGYPKEAPYDVIIVSAGAPEIPEALCQQLKVGGHMVIPVGPSANQRLLRITREAPQQYTEEYLEAVRFVPLIGEEGWQLPSK